MALHGLFVPGVMNGLGIPAAPPRSGSISILRRPSIISVDSCGRPRVSAVRSSARPSDTGAVYAFWIGARARLPDEQPTTTVCLA